jgi:pimeloyl-ACP methyl ester carboxylesterase
MLRPVLRREVIASYSTVRGVVPIIPTDRVHTLLTDLYGRGYSDAPLTTYDTNLYTNQLALLMQYLKWERANIVGVSMVRLVISERCNTF